MLLLREGSRQALWWDGSGRETGRREIDTGVRGAGDGRHVADRTDGVERGAGGEGVSATRHPCRATNGGECLGGVRA
jgi:hypothetical protein